ncbi:MAG: ABC transporter substrate-binding protein [Acidimicrobiales bacterium]|nr:ABC transporter substrate-binding protein [Acidimicrobiales bacterium]
MFNRSTHWRRLLSLLVALVLLGAACGGGGDDDGGGDGAANVSTSTTNPDANAEPVTGGTLRYGIEADTSSPWTPANMVCAISCHMISHAIYDPLTLANSDGEVQPNLLESFDHNDDYSVWTLVAREGVTFHDGTPFDADAIAYNIEADKASPLTGKAFAYIDTVESDGDMTVTVTAQGPWVSFPAFLSGQLGYQASPTWLEAVEAGTAEADEPVGTGAFVYESYEPGGTFRATANPDYWRTDAEGRPLPYLDAIEFVVQEHDQTRFNSLVSGETNIMHTSNGDTTNRLAREVESGTVEVDQITNNLETGYVLLNVGDDSLPTSDVRVRQALAYGFDYETRLEARSGGVPQIANGPFPPGTPGYLDDTGFPTFDPDKARELVDEYEAENGPIEIAYKTTNDQFNLVTAQLYQQFWEDIGIDVTLDQVEQGSFIGLALTGDFEAFGWRNHAGFDPDQQNIWWNSENANPPGDFGLNFGRIRDDVIDENLQIIRENPDQAARTEAAEAINRRFAEQVYNIWFEWPIWSIGHSPTVHNVLGGITEEGDPVLDVLGIGGAHQVSQIWIDESGN